MLTPFTMSYGSTATYVNNKDSKAGKILLLPRVIWIFMLSFAGHTKQAERPWVSTKNMCLSHYAPGSDHDSVGFTWPTGRNIPYSFPTLIFLRQELCALLGALFPRPTTRQQSSAVIW